MVAVTASLLALVVIGTAKDMVGHAYTHILYTYIYLSLLLPSGAACRVVPSVTCYDDMIILNLGDTIPEANKITRLLSR